MTIDSVALVSPYALSVHGGVQEQVLALSRTLSARGKKVLVVAPDGDDRRDYDTPAEVVRLGRRRQLAANGSRAPLTLSLRASAAAREVVRQFSPDVVHLHEPFAPVMGWGTLWAHQFPTVVTFHRGGSGPALRLGGPLVRRWAKGVDGAVAVSVTAQRTARRAYGIDGDVLFNAIESERFVQWPRERCAQPRLLYVGRLEERKGVETLVAAVRAHNSRGPTPWHLVVAGDGPRRDAIAAVVRGDENFTLLGAVDDATKRKWLRRADVFVAPSTHGESFGLVLLEAMASETLVVASDIDGYRDAAGGHAVLFRAGDPESLERAVVSALDGERDRVLSSARAYADQWSMARLVDEYEVRYARAIQRFATTR